MKTTFKVFLVLCVVLITAMLCMPLLPDQQVWINGEEIHGITGFGVILCGMIFAVFAGVLAFLFGGLVLAGVGVLLACIAISVFFGLMFALLPMFVPVLAVVGAVMLFQYFRRNRNRVSH
ncbi:hypothetical protein [Undibacterium oligocarboniphilum]|uniref:Transmembrane protein n=1 Tax=Undibacterium oligocarboniphilum TaxID=666702 RepID=A0A850QJV2_9BURK|nr:hypothetical protein [Undibacterium oligocarboniphilum]MBC3871799.1 hypothetical protein [Undibacterium oligocarboniphilum]NVO79349.1 hypothetical protein [Undibacterium oligocarboniphilum]